MTAEKPRTLKAARAAGFEDKRPDHYGGEEIELKGHVLVRDAKRAESRTEWGRRGYSVPQETHPHATVSRNVNQRWIKCEVYREDQVRPKRKIRAPKEVPLLAAVWAISRAAKRLRDAASSYYVRRMHGFAGSSREKKERLYALKGQAIHHLAARGDLVHAGYHRFPEDCWAEVLTGVGYRFHRPCERPNVDDSKTVSLEQIEAKPREADEPALMDAVFTVERFIGDFEKVELYEWPRPPREVSWSGSEDHDFDEDDFDEDDFDEDDFDEDDFDEAQG